MGSLAVSAEALTACAVVRTATVFRLPDETIIQLDSLDMKFSSKQQEVPPVTQNS